MDGEFCSLFRHRNGKHYLISRTELYGYSVLEVESGQEMHYVPSCVHPEDGQKVEEVFIWTSADPARICWLSPAAFGPVPTPLSYWTFPARSSPNPRSVGWICGTSLTRTTPDLTILSLSAGTTTACFFGAATQRMTGGKKFECR